MNQGEVYWADLGEGMKRPVVVVQNDLFNSSRISTTVVCAITSNLERSKAPGNVLLKKGEAGLSKASVINISQVFTLLKSDLVDRIGQLPNPRIIDVLNGLKLLLEPIEGLQ